VVFRRQLKLYERATKMAVKEKIQEKPNLSILAMISFIVSFSVARIFTSLHPTTVVKIGGIHLHHFWYGIALLAVGGWLGISYTSERIDRLAAILFGAGGGLIGDEVGLLLTLESYWGEITYTLVIIFLTFVSMLILVERYHELIRTEFTQFLRSNASLYIGVFLAAFPIGFVLETNNLTIITISSILAIFGCLIILASFVHRIRTRH
jgi:hypothetical protein